MGRFKLDLLLNAARLFYLRQIGVTIDYSCRLGKNINVNLRGYGSRKGNVIIKFNAEISNGVIIDCWGGKIFIDENVFIGPYTVIYGHGNIEIGKHSLIAMHCKILSSNHTIPARNIYIRSQPDILLPTKIGEDVWLGAGVTVLGGVTIGDGCIVGAGSVVTKNIPPYSIAVGVPAKVIRTRI